MKRQKAVRVLDRIKLERFSPLSGTNCLGFLRVCIQAVVVAAACFLYSMSSLGHAIILTNANLLFILGM